MTQIFLEMGNSQPRTAQGISAVPGYREALEIKIAVPRGPQQPPEVPQKTSEFDFARLRHKPKNAKGELPGSIDWLYSDGEQFESRHGRQPGSLKALALAREKQAKKS
jgi:hypothetical protein